MCDTSGYMFLARKEQHNKVSRSERKRETKITKKIPPKDKAILSSNYLLLVRLFGFSPQPQDPPTP